MLFACPLIKYKPDIQTLIINFNKTVFQNREKFQRKPILKKINSLSKKNLIISSQINFCKTYQEFLQKIENNDETNKSSFFQTMTLSDIASADLKKDLEKNLNLTNDKCSIDEEKNKNHVTEKFKNLKVEIKNNFITSPLLTANKVEEIQKIGPSKNTIVGNNNHLEYEEHEEKDDLDNFMIKDEIDKYKSYKTYFPHNNIENVLKLFRKMRRKGSSSSRNLHLSKKSKILNFN